MAQEAGKVVAPYGQWPSPITPELLSSSSISLHEVLVDQNSGNIYWIESRPVERGRYTIMEYNGSSAKEILPVQYSAHASVHELGGGSFAVSPNGKIIFSDENTQNVYELDPVSGEVVLILKSEQGLRYGGYCVHPLDENLVLAAKEDHREATPLTQAYGVHNTLVVIDRDQSTEQTVAVGDDFYAYPSFSPDGNRVSWIQWSHPDMPWTGTVLYVGDWVSGSIQNPTRITGESQKESVAQPRWSPDGDLLFASDKSGFWQLYLYSINSKSFKPISITELERSEFAIADWRLASSSYTFLDADTVIASCVTNATSNIILVDLGSGSYRDLKLPFLDLVMHSTGLFAVSKDKIVVLGSTQISPKELVLVSQVRSDKPKLETLQRTIDIPVEKGYFSKARDISVVRSSRKGSVYAFYFAPQNAQYQGQSDTPPPGLIQLHGGPNGCTSPALDLSIQFWTSRGYAVTAVNYAGSTGFGREYREELTGNWGLYDVQDVHDVANYLAEQGLFDRKRVGIYGGSAGGYGTLSAIHMFPAAFTAAVSSYGICDIKALQADSYKFESHDVERLILSSCDATDADGRARLYKERSPRFYVANITAPLLLLQGTEDVAVPPEQAHMMVAEMREHGRTVDIIEFEGEGHGWLKEDTILRAYKAQEAWWRTHLLEAA
ncbi:dipeptidyl aminopeptidase [Xylariales sp. PMI_506]|nr:dipeptidyl aminopeptidase [Xylariales sp. PMI_506]